MSTSEPARAPAITGSPIVPVATTDPARTATPESASADALFGRLRLDLDYLKPDELKRVDDAYRVASLAHASQTRLSGEPYITHPLAVAIAVAEWRLDVQAIIAALLHDVLEDTGVTKAEIAGQFGRTVADLVDGLSKLDKIEFQSYQEAQAENFRKMLLAMSRDLRVILIKLADRHHNMLTLGAMRPDKRQRIARETIEIYAPIANRLGLNKLCRELQNLAFEHMYPLRCRVLTKAVKRARGNRREMVARIIDSIRGRLVDAGIDAEVQGREKTIYSIYNKMLEKQLTFSQVLDIYGFRIIVDDAPTCYLTLGALHSLFKPIPGKFKDYVAIPKVNGYQSLHTTLIGPYGTPLEVQVRTRAMHQVAQAGVASHWQYKPGESPDTELQSKTHKWLQSLLELQQGAGDSKEFLEHVKVDLFPDEVYVFTPKGRILELPRGATVVDFAYAVHSDIGRRCVAARINHEPVPLRTELCNGDRVEISTSPEASPNPDWLSFVKTARARSKIRHFLRNSQHDESAGLGERLLDQAMRPLGGAVSMIGEATWDKFLKECGLSARSDVFVEIGLGRRNATLDARRLLVIGQFDPVDNHEQLPLSVTGEESAALQLGACCWPIPGDPIVGVITQGRGIVIHVHDCLQMRRLRESPERIFDVEWDAKPDRLFDVAIQVEVENASGVLARVATEISDAAANIENVGMDEQKPDAVTTIRFTIQVSHRIHLARVIRNLRRVPEVIRISRVRGDSRKSRR